MIFQNYCHFIRFLSNFIFFKYLEQHELEKNKLRELQDQFLELRKIELAIIQVHELFLWLNNSIMKQVSWKLRYFSWGLLSNRTYTEQKRNIFILTSTRNSSVDIRPRTNKTCLSDGRFYRAVPGADPKNIGFWLK